MTSGLRIDRHKTHLSFRGRVEMQATDGKGARIRADDHQMLAVRFRDHLSRSRGVDPTAPAKHATADRNNSPIRPEFAANAVTRRCFPPYLRLSLQQRNGEVHLYRELSKSRKLSQQHQTMYVI